MTDDPYRLPRTVVPRHYRIRIEPDLEAATFSGTEQVTVVVRQATDRVVLNAIELDIHEAWLVREGEGRVQASVEYDEESQRAFLGLSREVSPGTWELDCRFNGILNDQLRGFYRSTFTDLEGQEQVIATTQFEATDARRAFPCWDEPDFKATFGITLVVPDDLMVVSNGSEVSRMPTEGGKVAVTFADTIEMSTYLVAFVVGPFEATEPVDVNGAPLRVVAPRGKKHLTGYALECSRFCLEHLAAYYGIPYPGDKVDMVAIDHLEEFGVQHHLLEGSPKPAFEPSGRMHYEVGAAHHGAPQREHALVRGLEVYGIGGVGVRRPVGKVVPSSQLAAGEGGLQVFGGTEGWGARLHIDIGGEPPVSNRRPPSHGLGEDDAG